MPETPPAPHHATAPATARDHRRMPLATLAQRIAEADDRRALEELHNRRRPIFGPGGRRLGIHAWIETLVRGRTGRDLCGGDPVVMDRALDQAIDKFSRLPAPPEISPEVSPEEAPEAEDTADPEESEPRGPDCRYYFAEYARRLGQTLGEGIDGIVAEAHAEWELKRFVTRHVHLSCRDCRRRARGTTSRYRWRGLTLWLPVTLAGRERGRWLEENVGPVDPGRPGERERVQELVDERLSRRAIVSLDELGPTLGPGWPAEPEAEPAAWGAAVTTRGLAETVAQEKAANLKQQRPAIRRLGAEAGAGLIWELFERLSNGESELAPIAQRYGLSKATLSRFAGFRWNTPPAGVGGVGGAGGGASGGISGGVVPDLWRNTAQVLAGCEAFREAAVDAGVWPCVAAVARETKEPSDG